MNTREGSGNDTLWHRLAPNADVHAREAVTGRSTGVLAARGVRHDVADEPRRPWVPRWAQELLNPWADYDGAHRGHERSIRYGERAGARGRTGLY